MYRAEQSGVLLPGAAAVEGAQQGGAGLRIAFAYDKAAAGGDEKNIVKIELAGRSLEKPGSSAVKGVQDGAAGTHHRAGIGMAEMAGQQIGAAVTGLLDPGFASVSGEKDRSAVSHRITGL